MAADFIDEYCMVAEMSESEAFSNVPALAWPESPSFGSGFKIPGPGQKPKIGL
jgi:hypothetical protein